MSNIREAILTSDTVFLGGKIENDETCTFTITGTAATIDSNAVFPITSQAGLDVDVIVDGAPAQNLEFTDAIDKGYWLSDEAVPDTVADQSGATLTITINAGQPDQQVQAADFPVAALTDMDDVVTFINTGYNEVEAGRLGGQFYVVTTNRKGAGTTVELASTVPIAADAAAPTQVNTADDLVAQINEQIKAVSSVVGTGQVSVITDREDASASLAVANDNTNLNWAAPVAGTGTSAPMTVRKGTVMGQITATGIFVPYDSGAADGSENPVGALDKELVLNETTTGRFKIAKAGKAVASKLTVHPLGVPLTGAERTQLIALTSIVPVDRVDNFRIDH